MSLFIRFSFLIALFTVIAVTPVIAQSGNLDFFELQVDVPGDSSRHNITYLLGVSDNSQVLNLSVVLKDSEGQSVHQLTSDIATLKANNAWRLENGILYLTIETGTHVPSLYYEAKATLTLDTGEPLEYVRTKQM